MSTPNSNPEPSPNPDEPQADPFIERWSLEAEAWREALFERYIRSKEAGCDLGNAVINRWVQMHWAGFLRERWIQHMLGIRYWTELDRDEFGILKHIPAEKVCLLEEIIDQLRRGAENLSIIRWSLKTKCPADQNAIQDLLLLINVNAHRMRCFFSDQ